MGRAIKRTISSLANIFSLGARQRQGGRLQSTLFRPGKNAFRAPYVNKRNRLESLPPNFDSISAKLHAIDAAKRRRGGSGGGGGSRGGSRRRYALNHRRGRPKDKKVSIIFSSLIMGVVELV